MSEPPQSASLHILILFILFQSWFFVTVILLLLLLHLITHPTKCKHKLKSACFIRKNQLWTSVSQKSLVRSLNSTGNSFQQLGPATAKALKSQSVQHIICCLIRILFRFDSCCGCLRDEHLLGVAFFQMSVYNYNKVHHKDNISRIFWYSDWLHNTTSARNSIFVTNHNTTSCRRSIMQPIRLP